jgi:hypothetical protein
MAELLPVTYFHNVFTLPHELNPPSLCNRKVIFDMLFRSVFGTFLTFARNAQNGLGGKLGFLRSCTAEIRPSWIISICTVYCSRCGFI